MVYLGSEYTRIDLRVSKLQIFSLGACGLHACPLMPWSMVSPHHPPPPPHTKTSSCAVVHLVLYPCIIDLERQTVDHIDYITQLRGLYDLCYSPAVFHPR